MHVRGDLLDARQILRRNEGKRERDNNRRSRETFARVTRDRDICGIWNSRELDRDSRITISI